MGKYKIIIHVVHFKLQWLSLISVGKHVQFQWQTDFQF
jgi:hypothetical protein